MKQKKWNRFVEWNAAWLDLEFLRTSIPSNPNFNLGGRLELSFEDSSFKSQKRKALKLSRSEPPKKLISAFLKSIKKNEFYLCPVSKKRLSNSSLMEDRSISMTPQEALS